MEQPTCEEILNKFKFILQGKVTREEVADFASYYVFQDTPNIENELTWKLLTIACGVDLKNSPDDYLHDEQDIKDWITSYSPLLSAE